MGFVLELQFDAASEVFVKNVMQHLKEMVSQALLDFHQAVYSCVNQSEYQLHPLYVPGRWVPHITLATKLSKEQLAQAVERLELNLPLEIGVSRLALVKYPTPLQLLKTWVFEKV
jgi:2'-5' RNA ligase